MNRKMSQNWLTPINIAVCIDSCIIDIARIVSFRKKFPYIIVFYMDQTSYNQTLEWTFGSEELRDGEYEGIIESLKFLSMGRVKNE